MGSGQSGQTKVVKINIPVVQISPEGEKVMLSSLFYHEQQKLMVAEPFSHVEPNYQALRNIYKDQAQQPLISGIRVVHGLVGLQNLGNTCYFNTALHCLVHTQPLMDYFLSRLHENEINKRNANGTKGDVARVFAKLLQEVWRGSRSVGIMQLSESEMQQSQGSPSKSPNKRVSQFQESVSPIDLITTVNKHSKMFRIGFQEDCQELLAYLLDMVHEDLNRAPKGPMTIERDYIGEDVMEEWAAESWAHHLKSSKSIIVDIFQGQLKSTLCCKECGLKSHKFEAFLFLSLPIPKPQQDIIQRIEQIDSTIRKAEPAIRLQPIPINTPSNQNQNQTQKNNFVDDQPSSRRQSFRRDQQQQQQQYNQKQQQQQDSKVQSSSNLDSPPPKPLACTLDECLKLFSSEELLTGTSKWFCPECKHNVDATKQLQLWKLPNVLIIHVKRFEYTERGGKINTKVMFPIEELDLTDFVGSPQRDPPIYTLYAVAQHQGNMVRGHYTAAVKNRNDGQWYWYNDHQVMQVVDVPSLIVNQFAYVLFYQKRTSESIFRQTLSRPDRWPHMPADKFSQTLPVSKSSTKLLQSPNTTATQKKKSPNTDMLILEDGEPSNGLLDVSQEMDSPVQSRNPSRQGGEYSVSQSVMLNRGSSGVRNSRKPIQKPSNNNIFSIDTMDADLSNIQGKKASEKKEVSDNSLSKATSEFQIKTVKMDQKYQRK